MTKENHPLLPFQNTPRRKAKVSRFPSKTQRSFLLLALSGLLSSAPANAQLAHRYMLSDGTDTVGGANGTLAGAASFSTSPGMLTTTGTSAADFLRLPSSIGTGITGNFSIETYVVQNGFGNSNSSLFSINSAANNLILFKPNRSGSATASGTSSVNFQQPGVNANNQLIYTGFAGGTNVLNGPGNTGPGTEHQIVLTYNFTSGSLSVFRDGSLLGSTTYGAGFSFQSAAGAFNGINGGDSFADLSFNGSTDDFRIYSSALTAAQVSSLYSAGPNASDASIGAIAVPEPSSLAAGCLLVGLLSLHQLRRRWA